MTKIAKATEKTMHELAKEWASESCRNSRVIDLELFGETIRYRTICEAWGIISKTYGVDVDFKEFENLFTR